MHTTAKLNKAIEGTNKAIETLNTTDAENTKQHNILVATVNQLVKVVNEMKK